MTDDVMNAAMAEARRVAADLVERRVKGVQRLVAKKDRLIQEQQREIELLRRQLGQEDTTNE